MRTVALGCAVAWLTASCATSPALPKSSWDDVCYVGFSDDVASLAGDDAVDCGFYRAPKLPVQRAVQACMRQAEKEGRGFMAGYSSFGFDSAYCHAVVRAEAGEYVDLAFDFDVTGRLGTDPSSQSALWVSRCSALRYSPGTMGQGSFFDTQSCEEVPAVRDALPSSMQAAPAEELSGDTAP